MKHRSTCSVVTASARTLGLEIVQGNSAHIVLNNPAEKVRSQTRAGSYSWTRLIPGTPTSLRLTICDIL